MSKYSKLNSWIYREFPVPIAREYEKRHWKWRRASQNRSRPYIWSTAYAWALRRTKRYDELDRFLKSEQRVKANWAALSTGDK